MDIVLFQHPKRCTTLCSINVSIDMNSTMSGDNVPGSWAVDAAVRAAGADAVAPVDLERLVDGEVASHIEAGGRDGDAGGNEGEDGDEDGSEAHSC